MDKREADTLKGIRRLRLETHALEEMKAFYARTLQLEITDSEPNQFTVHAGGTLLTFVGAESGRPVYHFAFNIPENMFAEAKAWLRTRVAILRNTDGSEDFEFRSWNAHACYFLDPAGNIVEFIARHNLQNARAGDFGPQDILYASEIGIVVDDVRAAAEAVRDELGMRPFVTGMPDPGADFCAAGDDHALLIIVKKGRAWNVGGTIPAEVFSTQVVIAGDRDGDLKLAGFPYDIRIVNRDGHDTSRYRMA
ncbi:MAG TPA: hypothetical protein VG711_03890 [Phycisphaerales bacterium]|nr:hypothetical protein [Phycisphaerales bacterium]